jgi:4-amino-4-deoxy-L-arabinose transferase-like glycosyltransferase
LPALPSIVFGALFTLAVAWMLGNICLSRLPAPPVITLAVGAAAESTIVFVLLAAGMANRFSFAVLAAVCLGLLLWLRHTAPRLADPVKARADRVTLFVSGAALACYAALYLINALAPELEPDAIAYHLGLTSEYVRLGGFPHRVGFYEMVPQGLEMLFVPAFAFGRHSAARLVHCAFLLASVPLILSVARRLGLPDRAGLAAAVLYFCAPMAGITGTSTYTDAGAVFFVLDTFYLLLVWRDTRDRRYLIPAGITAGFCYAIKLPGGLVVILAIAFVLFTERSIHVKTLALLAGAAILMAAPWVLRAGIMTGNPLAPLFNRLFPNEYFHPAMEIDLARALSSWRGVPAWRVPYEIIVGGAFQGIMGLAFFALPAGLLALRKPAGRLCWLAAALLALPWFWNTGGRFLMPSLPFLALALAMALPRQLQWAAIAVQAIACWPQVFPLYHPAYTWRVERIPWRAALRIESEPAYLARLQGQYQIARLLNDYTAPGDRIFSLVSVPRAYTDRTVLEFWHTAQADDLGDALRVALAPTDLIYNVKADWTPRPLEGLRIRVPRAAPAEWLIHEIQLFSGDDQILNRPDWQLRAWPNVWDLPLAFDDNQATRWRTWEPIRAGMYVEVDFAAPQMLSGAVMMTPDAMLHLPFDFYGRERGAWHLLTGQPVATPRQVGDVRLGATRAIRRAGFHYLLISTSKDEGNGRIGAAMAGHEVEWGLEKVGEYGPIYLYRIR